MIRRRWCGWWLFFLERASKPKPVTGERLQAEWWPAYAQLDQAGIPTGEYEAAVVHLKTVVGVVFGVELDLTLQTQGAVKLDPGQAKRSLRAFGFVAQWRGDELCPREQGDFEQSPLGPGG